MDDDRLRNALAADQTVDAAERTYASWVWMGLAAMASGVGAKKLLEGMIPSWTEDGPALLAYRPLACLRLWAVLATGSVLVPFARFSFGLVIWREVFPGPPPPRDLVRRLHPALVVSFNVCLFAVSLAALPSILFGRTGGE
jgi:putative membrane protein